MKSRSLFALGASGLACIAALSIAFSAAAQGTNTNTPAAACMVNPAPMVPPPTGSPMRFTNGFWINLSTTATFELDCPVTSGRPEPTSTVADIYVDGNQPAGQSTSCSAVSYNFDGTFQGSASQSNITEQSFDVLLILPVSIATETSYITVDCLIPPGGRLRGVQVFQ